MIVFAVLHVLPLHERRLALLRQAQNVSEHGDTARGKGCCGVAYMMLAASVWTAAADFRMFVAAAACRVHMIMSCSWM